MSVQPRQIAALDVYRGRYSSRDFMVDRSQIPAAFDVADNPWTAVASTLMWLGSDCLISCTPRAGINAQAALLHVGAVLLAVDFSVEVREGVAGYLLCQWFESIETTKASAPGTDG